MTVDLEKLRELSAKAIKAHEYLNSLGRADGDYYTPNHDKARDAWTLAENTFEVALVNWFRANSQVLAEQARDAERYRWLRNPPPGEHERIAVCGPDEAYFEERLDAAIDVELSKGSPHDA